MYNVIFLTNQKFSKFNPGGGWVWAGSLVVLWLSQAHFRMLYEENGVTVFCIPFLHTSLMVPLKENITRALKHPSATRVSLFYYSVRNFLKTEKTSSAK